MIIFSIITLALIICGLQHLLNWIWRKSWDSHADFGFFAFIATILIIVATYSAFYHIIMWGKDLV